MLFDRFFNKTPSRLDLEIERVYKLMSSVEVKSEEYRIYQERLQKLYEIKDKKPERKPLVPKEAQGPLITGLFTLAAIGATKKLELDGPITTKGWSLIPKGRV